MRVSAAICLINPQSAMAKTQHRFKRSVLELRVPMNGLKCGARSSRRMHSAPLVGQIPNLPTKAGLEG
eukprot:1243287-Alexandrium_andersonii.AAC.1